MAEAVGVPFAGGIKLLAGVTLRMKRKDEDDNILELFDVLSEKEAKQFRAGVLLVLHH